jgi:hypothetical protein
VLKIVTFKWDAGLHPKKKMKFETQHVRILHNMLKRNLQVPFELICITDDPAEFLFGTYPFKKMGEITILRLWSWGKDYPGCFRRLKLFDPEMKKFIGERFVLMDLDVVIARDITSLFKRNEDFIIWGDRPMRNPYCGSLFMLKAGARSQVWDSFNIEDYPCKRDNGTYPLGTDQNHIYNCIPNEATWNIKDGIYNFGFDIRFNNKLLKSKKVNYSKIIKKESVRGGNGQLPENARIIFFNGKDDPSVYNLFLLGELVRSLGY